MPIRPELRKYYGASWRTEIRPRILKRAGECCEICGVPNHTTVLRACGWWTPATLEATVFKFGGRLAGKEVVQLPWMCASLSMPKMHGFPASITHWVGIVLTIAHLNHVAGDDRDENLMALCQWCHLNHDKEQHRESRSVRKDQGRPLLAEVAHASQH